MLFVTEQECRTCKIVKPRDRFYKAARNTNGISRQCKQCDKDSITPERAQKHRDRQNASNKRKREERYKTDHKYKQFKDRKNALNKARSNGTALPCCRPGCTASAKYQNQTLIMCDRHYKIQRMRDCASRYNKEVPEWAWFEANWPKDMTCPVEACGKAMQLSVPIRSPLSDTISLQHNLDGTMALICHSCNVGHAGNKLGDAYLSLGPGLKHCPSCLVTKHIDAFHKRKNKANGWCKECTNKKANEYYHNNVQGAL